jgi:hypothetical protein
MNMPSLLPPPRDPVDEIPADAWELVQDAHDLCEDLERQGRSVRFRRDSPRPTAEMASSDGAMTILLSPGDLVDPARLRQLADAS